MSSLALSLGLLLGQVCPAGQQAGNETEGHCCWAGQVWSSRRDACVGIPLSCPAGLVVAREACAPEDAAPPFPVPTAKASPPTPELAAADTREEHEVVSEEAKEVAARYSNYGRLDLRALALFDFFSPVMEGGLLDLALTFERTARGRIGMSVGLGAMSTLFEPTSARSVTYVSTSLFLGARLGLSMAEVIFRFGCALASVRRDDAAANQVKLFGGAELFLAVTKRGSGFSLGFDVMFLSGVTFVPRVGFVL